MGVLLKEAGIAIVAFPTCICDLAVNKASELFLFKLTDTQKYHKNFRLSKVQICREIKIY
jgi:hypothetical protein